MEPNQRNTDKSDANYAEPSTSTGKRKPSTDEDKVTKVQATERNKGATYRSQLPRETRKNESQANRVRLQANYFRLAHESSWNISQYHVSFEPPVEMANLQRALIAQHVPVIGNFYCDGAQLFTVRRLQGRTDHISLTSTSRDGQIYTVKLKYTGCIQRDSQEFLRILNLIQRRATKALDLQLVGRNYYDPHAKVELADFKMELWPGFNTSIREHVGGMMLNCDVIHKVMHTDTVYDVLQQARRSDPRTWKSSFVRNVLGMTVFTAHNNRTYRIDDVDFDISPMTKFRRRDVQISIDEYFSERYNTQIRDKNQPLLIARVKDRTLRGAEDRVDWLVPELCRLTGLSERQRTNIPLKNAMRPYAQMNARVKIDRLMTFNERIQQTPESQAVFEDWKLRLAGELVTIDGIRMVPERVHFGGDVTMSFNNASWDNIWARNVRLFRPVALERWCLVCPIQAQREAMSFAHRIHKVAKNMGFNISAPIQVACQNDHDMIRRIDGLKGSGYQLLLFVITTTKMSSSDIYASIKKKCHIESPSVASQVIHRSILLKSNDSVATKIAIQMCTKLGGAPWCPSIPMAGVMNIGFDMSKDAVNKSKSFGCLVATMDLKQDVEFFSHVSSVASSEKISGDFVSGVVKAIRHWHTKYRSLPSKLVIYRGGVGDGDLQYLEQIELVALKTAMAEMYSSDELKLLYIVVAKHINTRIFEGDGNPQVGTVVDDVIKLAGRDEFYMISATSRQGTVAPTNYHILEDTTDLPFERIQIWTWKQAHMYYNWCGTIRVPAVLQYATKLGFLVSNFLHRIPPDGQHDKLYFL